MSRILILGIGPLPCENTQVLNSSCYRSWQFAEPLAEGGHEVLLVCLRIPHPCLVGPPVSESRLHGFRYLLVDEASRFRDDSFFNGLIREFRPQGIIGANVYPSARACELNPPVPIWADINGYIMSEAQAKAERDGDNLFVRHFWLQMRPSLRRADHFSVCSGPQRLALIGELGLCGRLNAANLRTKMVDVLPIARDTEPFRICEPILKGEVCPEDAFIVLSSGLLQLWWDIPASLAALERAMEVEPRIHFVSLGDLRPGQDEKTYPSFIARVNESRYRDRFHMLGWASAQQVGSCLLQADVGISVDRPCYEPYFGARNRITEMLKAGLVPVVTRGTEISLCVEREHLGLVSDIGDAEALAANLVWAARNPHALSEMGVRCKECFLQDYTLEATAGRYLEWAESPRHAPDYREPTSRELPGRRIRAAAGHLKTRLRNWAGKGSS